MERGLGLAVGEWSGMHRIKRLVPAVILLIALVAVHPLAVYSPAAVAAEADAQDADTQEAVTQEAEGPPGVTGPSVVRVPYEGEIEVSPAPEWTFTDCSLLLRELPWVTECEAGGFTAASNDYDPDLEPVRVEVPMRGPDGDLAIPYLFLLEPPALPDAPDTRLDVPVVAGARTLIPFAQLGMECQRCTPGTAAAEIEGVDPKDAVRASVTGTHLVVTAAQDARGEVAINLRLGDDFEQASKIFIVTLEISAPDPRAVHALHRVIPLGDEPVELDATDFFVTHGPADDAPELAAVSCGEPLAGAVACSPAGTILYTPGDGMTLDQFAVRLVTTDGRQALASVTLGAATAGLVPATGQTRSPLALDLPFTEPDEGEEEAAGATIGFTRLMDALGA